MSDKTSVVRRAKKVSLTEHAIGEIRRAISAGDWPVGTRIPSEAQLVEDLGVGRTSVREAIRALEHSGLLVVRHGDGTYVNATDENHVALQRRLRNARARDVIDVRRALDVMAARLAARNRTPEELEVLRERFRERNAAAEKLDADAFTHADSVFHETIARLSHNDVVAELYEGLGEAIRASVRPDNCPTGFADDPDDSHAHLMRAIEEQDADAATAAVLRLLDHQEELLSGDSIFSGGA
ncbi:FadR/GntR family transcriptional regulator [Planotetraspora sp. GP83]|uniref:FadR/GntR family transcriptional regulator n=1 Tax=Planotetraspora sp. GP83 TaxID=3156264 RepID=UPI00351468B8